jgi:hypothetical protein
LAKTKEVKEDLRANTLKLRQALNLKAKGIYLEAKHKNPAVVDELI